MEHMAAHILLGGEFNAGSQQVLAILTAAAHARHAQQLLENGVQPGQPGILHNAKPGSFAPMGPGR